MQAIENTSRLYDMTEEIDLDSDIAYPKDWKPGTQCSFDDLQFNIPIKYPLLYGSAEADEQHFKDVCATELQKKLDNGVIPRSQEKAFREAIKEELEEE